MYQPDQREVSIQMAPLGESTCIAETTPGMPGMT